MALAPSVFVQLRTKFYTLLCKIGRLSIQRKSIFDIPNPQISRQIGIYLFFSAQLPFSVFTGNPLQVVVTVVTQV